MSHSTHVGFNAPPIWSGSVGVGSPFGRLRQLAALMPFQSRDDGVRNSAIGFVMVRPVPPSPRTASVRLTPECALLSGVFREPLLLPSPAVGVGHILAAIPSGIPPC
jgi:hypothetical protein